MSVSSDPAINVQALFDLTGRTALVTGASRGIGAVAAATLDAAGARVILCGRDAVRLRELAGSLTNDPVVLTADLAAPDGIRDLLSSARAAVDHVDVLINNAGMHAPGPAISLDADDWDRIQAVNLRSAFLLCRGIAPAMAAVGWGKIVNISSVLGLVGDIEAAPYAASKAGLIGLTRALAAEWAASGVGVNALCPGWIETEMVKGLRANEAFDRRVRRRTPVGRWGRPADLSGSLLFLASPASDFMAGQTLVVDGGLTASW